MLYGDTSTYRVVPALLSYVSYPTVRVLMLAGYKDLFQIADENPFNIRNLPFVGQHTFKRIEQCLNDRGLRFDYSLCGPLQLDLDICAEPSLLSSNEYRKTD